MTPKDRAWHEHNIMFPAKYEDFSAGWDACLEWQQEQQKCLTPEHIATRHERSEC